MFVLIFFILLLLHVVDLEVEDGVVVYLFDELLEEFTDTLVSEGRNFLDANALQLFEVSFAWAFAPSFAISLSSHDNFRSVEDALSFLASSLRPFYLLHHVDHLAHCIERRFV